MIILKLNNNWGGHPSLEDLRHDLKNHDGKHMLLPNYIDFVAHIPNDPEGVNETVVMRDFKLKG